MISAIILATDAVDGPARADFTARCLASLVEACVQGLVADAVLIGPPGRDLGRIAEDAGCGFIETPDATHGLREALAQVRRDHVLLISAGYAVERGFADELNEVFVYHASDTSRTLRATPSSFATRLLPRLSKSAGIIAPRRILTQIDSSFDMDKLARKLKGADLATRARRLT